MDRWQLVRVWPGSGEEEAVGLVFEGETAEADAWTEAGLQNEMESRDTLGDTDGIRYEARPVDCDAGRRRSSPPQARQGATA